eukprot:TRINITY_DN82460_c0_g1_i1.p1 TRINITY_DN82460_c0_g1~~TRINITY_DN82460_c0_g1_i1.p1  ORF type:complete len:510 (-),score=69.56 TRINITY_DN82460_c0_g1_i1:110-1594(-)
MKAAPPFSLVQDPCGFFEKDRGRSLLSTTRHTGIPEIGKYTGRQEHFLDPFAERHRRDRTNVPHSYDVKYAQVEPSVHCPVMPKSPTHREPPATKENQPKLDVPAKDSIVHKPSVWSTHQFGVAPGREREAYFARRPEPIPHALEIHPERLTAAFPLDEPVQPRCAIDMKRVPGRDTRCWFQGMPGGWEPAKNRRRMTRRERTQEDDLEDQWFQDLGKSAEQLEHEQIEREQRGARTSEPPSHIWESPKQLARREEERKRAIKGFDMDRAIPRTKAPFWVPGSNQRPLEKEYEVKYSVVDSRPAVPNFDAYQGRKNSPKSEYKNTLKEILQSEEVKKALADSVPELSSSTISTRATPNIFLSCGRADSRADDVEDLVKTCHLLIRKKKKKPEGGKSSEPRDEDYQKLVEANPYTKLPSLLQDLQTKHLEQSEMPKKINLRQICHPNAVPRQLAGTTDFPKNSPIIKLAAPVPKPVPFMKTKPRPTAPQAPAVRA